MDNWNAPHITVLSQNGGNIALISASSPVHQQLTVKKQSEEKKKQNEAEHMTHVDSTGLHRGENGKKEWST